jgi:ribose 5-phosphate isomerase RpiB
VAEETMRQIVDAWLTTPFEGGRHATRIAKLDS